MSTQESSQNLANTNADSTAVATTETVEENSPVMIHPVIGGVADLSIIKQVGLMLALAFSVAVGVAIVLWSQEPTYDLLFSSLAEQESAEILETLDRLAVEYKIDSNTGAIMVASGKARDIKLKLAGEGLPRTNTIGYELLDKESSFTTSKNVEMKRFQQVLEGEISRTIMAIDNIKTAKVLLALPKQSVFVRKQKKPSASVILSLYRGRSLEKSQVEAIVHLVSSSVPMMEASQVTVVDQRGRLLNSKENASDLSSTIKQFDYKREIEDHLMARIENILMPIVGREGLRVQISADVDFSVTEKTQELFNPELNALRSEKTTEDLSSMSAIQGVPGALSNQPPPAGVAPEIAVGSESKAKTPSSSSRTATRNFELDKTITHTRLASGGVRRLSVAVVIDDQKIINTNGEVSYLPFSQEKLLRLTSLVKGAIGYNEARGDIVTLTNTTFKVPEVMESLPEIPLWEKTWFLDLMKQLAAALVVLFIVFGVLKPTMKGLVARIEEEEEERPDFIYDENGIAIPVRYDEDGNMIIMKNDDDLDISESMEDLLLLDAPQTYEKRLEYIQRLVDEDPKIVAQAIRRWVGTDGK